MAHSQIFNDLVLGDIAVNKQPGVIAGVIPDDDGLDQALGLSDADHHTLNLYQTAQVRGLSRLSGGDRLGLGRCGLSHLFDGGNGKLPLPLIGGGGAGNAHDVANLVVARHRECVDAPGAVLDIDAVKECGLLVVAGGIGGHHTLDGVLDLLLGLGLHLGNRGDLGRVEVIDQVLTDLVIGVVLFRRVVHLCLDLEVGQEGGAGHHDQASACQLLGGQDQMAVRTVGIGVFGDGTQTAVVILVVVGGIAAVKAIDHRGHGAGYRGRGRSGSIHHVDRGTAVLAVQLGMHIAVGILRIILHPVEQEGVEVIAAQIEPLGLPAVVLVVLELVVTDAQAGAQGLQDQVLLGGHVLARREVLIALIVVAPAGQDHRAARGVKAGNGLDLLRCIALIGVSQGVAVTAGGGGEHNGLVFAVCVGAGLQQLLAGVQLHSAHRVAGGQSAEIAHGFVVVAVYILVVVGGVDADIHQLSGVQYIQGDVLSVGILHARPHQYGGNGDRHYPGLRRRIRPCHILGAIGGERIAGGIGIQILAAAGVGDGLDAYPLFLPIEEGGSKGQRLVGDRNIGAAGHGGNAQLHRLTHPHRGGHGNIAVILDDPDKVVAVLGGDGAAQLTGSQLGRVVPGVGHHSGVGHYLHPGDGIGGIRVIHADVDAGSLRHHLNDRAHHLPIEGVADLQILILGGVDPIVADGLIDALHREVVGEDHVPGVICIAPLALVVVLIVGGGHMPALVQGHDVLFVAGIVAALSDGALTVAHLHQVNPAVNDRIIVPEISKVSKGVAGMVELTDGIGQILIAQQLVIGLQAGIVILFIQGSVVPGDDTRRVEGVDMSGPPGPGHLKPRQGDDLSGVLGVEGVDGTGVGIPLGLALCRHLADIVEGGLRIGVVLGIKVIGVVCEGHKIHVLALRESSHVAQAVGQGARAVGEFSGMRVELSKVELILGGTHCKYPGAGHIDAIRPGQNDGDGGLALGKVFRGAVGDASILHRGGDRRSVHRHGHGGVLPAVGKEEADLRPHVLPGLGAGRGEHLCDHRLIQHCELSRAGEAHSLGVRTGDGDSQLARRHGGSGDGNGIGPTFIGGLEGEATAADREAAHAENGLHGKGEGIVLSHITVGQRAEGHRRQVDHPVAGGDAVRQGVELEGIDVGVAVAIQAVCLIRAAIILQILRIIFILGLPAHQIVAAVVGGHCPVGRRAGVLVIIGVAAGAVGAEIAIMGRFKPEVAVSALLHRKHPASVGGGCLPIRHGGGGIVDRGAGGVVVLSGQHALGAHIVQHHSVAGLNGQCHLGRLRQLGQGVLCRVKGIGPIELECIDLSLVVVHAVAGKAAAIVFQILRLSRKLGVDTFDEEAARPGILQLIAGVLPPLRRQTYMSTVQVEEGAVRHALEDIVVLLVQVYPELGRSGRYRAVVRSRHRSQLVFAIIGL